MRRKSVLQNLKKRNKRSLISKLVRKKRNSNDKDKKKLKSWKKKEKLLKKKLLKLQINLL